MKYNEKNKKAIFPLIVRLMKDEGFIYTCLQDYRNLEYISQMWNHDFFFLFKNSVEFFTQDIFGTKDLERVSLNRKLIMDLVYCVIARHIKIPYSELDKEQFHLKSPVQNVVELYISQVGDVLLILNLADYEYHTLDKCAMSNLLGHSFAQENSNEGFILMEIKQ